MIIKNYRSYPILILIFFILIGLGWYLVFGSILAYDKIILLAILSIFSLGSFIGIFIKLRYRQIPEHYSEGAKTAMRIFIFMALLGLLIYHIDKYKLFD